MCTGKMHDAPNVDGIFLKLRYVAYLKTTGYAVASTVSTCSVARLCTWLNLLNSAILRAMQNKIDWPNTIRELSSRFSQKEQCAALIEQLRWPDGFTCPKCGASDPWRMDRGLILCRRCRRQTSVIEGTVFQSSHTSLPDWFMVMWHVCSRKNGVSALSIMRDMQFGSYNTAWLCLHKLRKAMVLPGRDTLEGIVEADETYIGGMREGKAGRGAFGKTPVLLLCEVKTVEDGDGTRHEVIGRIRACAMPDTSGASILPLIQQNVTSGATIRTDGWSAYNGLSKIEYSHVTVRACDVPFSENLLPNCHLVASLVKRWMLGTLQGNAGTIHIQDFLNEFTFRFNRRASKSRGLLWRRLLETAVAIGATTRDAIVHPGEAISHHI